MTDEPIKDYLLRNRERCVYRRKEIESEVNRLAVEDSNLANSVELIDKWLGELNADPSKKVFASTPAPPPPPPSLAMATGMLRAVTSGKKTRNATARKSRAPDSIVITREAIARTVDYLKKYRPTKENPVSVREVFEKILDSRPGWENGYGSFGAIFSVLDKYDFPNIKMIGVVKKGRRNALYLKYARNPK